MLLVVESLSAEKEKKKKRRGTRGNIWYEIYAHTCVGTLTFIIIIINKRENERFNRFYASTLIILK